MATWDAYYRRFVGDTTTTPTDSGGGITVDPTTGEWFTNPVSAPTQTGYTPSPTPPSVSEPTPVQPVYNPVTPVTPASPDGSKSGAAAPPVSGGALGDNKLYPEGTVSLDGKYKFTYLNGLAAGTVQGLWLGLLDNTRNNVGGEVPASSVPTAPTGGGTVGGNPAPGTPAGFIPAPPGYAWSIDPLTGNKVLVDLTPLDPTQPLSGWHWTVDDPTNPNVGKWTFAADPTQLQDAFQGIPNAILPWLKYSLDQGGSLDGVPEGPVQSWLNFIFTQASLPGQTRPSEVPFGTGIPNFKPISPTPSTGGPVVTPTPTPIDPGQYIPGPVPAPSPTPAPTPPVVTPPIVPAQPVPVPGMPPYEVPVPPVTPPTDSKAPGILPPVAPAPPPVYEPAPSPPVNDPWAPRNPWGTKV